MYFSCFMPMPEPINLARYAAKLQEQKQTRMLRIVEFARHRDILYLKTECKDLYIRLI